MYVVDNKKELAKLLMEGKKLVRANGSYPNCYAFFDTNGGSSTPFKYRNDRGNIVSLNSLWGHREWKEYEEPVKELTVEEIEAKLGYKVKVVGG